MTIPNTNLLQPNAQANCSMIQPPPVTGDGTAFANQAKLINFNKTYLTAHNLAPRRPAYSTSRVEENLKSKNNQQGLIFEPRNNFYMKLEQPIRSVTNIRLSDMDRTKPRTGNYIKNCQSNLYRTSHYSSSESIQPCNLYNSSYNNQRQNSSRVKPVMLFDTETEDIMNRKSAFQPVKTVSQKQTNELLHEEASPYTVQQQTAPSPSSGTSSTTSSISSSTTATSSSQCISNSTSVNNSLSYHSKQSDNIINGARNHENYITNNTTKADEPTSITSFIASKPVQEAIRSGSVSSVRSIYEQRLKSLNESSVPHGLVSQASHSQRLNSSGSVQPNPALKFQSVKVEKYPRRRTHLSDNDFLQVFLNNQSNASSTTNKCQPQTPDALESAKMLNRYLASTEPRSAPSNEEAQRINKAAQRRLSHHNNRNFSENNQPEMRLWPQQSKFSNRRSVYVDNDGDVDVAVDEDGLILDDDYGDDDIFANEDEVTSTSNELAQENGTASKTSPSACSTSSSVLSTSSDNNNNNCQKTQTNSKSPASSHQYTSPSISSHKSFSSSASSYSLAASILGKPPHVPTTPKSPKSLDSKQAGIFNFNVPNNNTQRSQIYISDNTNTNTNNNGKEAFSLSNDSNFPPPLPSQSTQLTSSVQANFPIPDALNTFAHFDVQSVFFHFERAKLVKEALSLPQNNMRTGASAASRPANPECDKSLPNRLLKSSHAGSLKCRSGINSISSTLGSLEQSSSVDEENIAGENGNRCRLSSSVFLNLNSDRMSMSGSNSFKKNRSNARTTVDNLSLVEECSSFRLELGGDVFKGLGLCGDLSQRRMMKLNSVNILDRVRSVYKKEILDLIDSNTSEPFITEFQDWGAYFYRVYFMNQEHATYLGNDPQIGPCAISIKREKLCTDVNGLSGIRNVSANTVKGQVKKSANGHDASLDGAEKTYEYAYRLIFRSSDLNCLRGTILEEHLHTKHPATNKGLVHKEIFSYLFPDLDLGCLRLADSKIEDELAKLDESSLIKRHKIGVLLCKAGQSTEEHMYSNKDSTPLFDEFLDLLGGRVALKGFAGHSGGLDVVNDTTSTHSVYTRFRGQEIMFHVSTLLPYSVNDKQQLTRKRHIGNDLVTIIFQEPGALPFSPKTIRSHFQHIFIIVRALPNSSNGKTQYSVAVSYSTDVPSFGPPLPKNPLFLKSREFREFFLTKIVNADAAAMRCAAFTQIKLRAQQGKLKDIIQNHSTKVSLINMSTSISGSVAQKLALFNFGSIKQKKTRSKSLQMFNSLLAGSESFLSLSLAQLMGCIFWNINSIEDFQYTLTKNCYLGVSREHVVAVDPSRKSVLFSVASSAVIGWTFAENSASFMLYFDQGEFINVKCRTVGELQQVTKRLEYFTRGCRTLELCLEKKDYGKLGFNIHHDGVVTEVEKYSLAYYRGLKQGTRILKINDHYVIRLSHEEMIDILRKSTCLKVTFLVPLEDGSCRRGQEDNYSLFHYLSTCSSENERLIDSMNQAHQPPSSSMRPHGIYPGGNKKMSESQLLVRHQQASRLAQSRQSIASENHTSRNAAIYDDDYLANYAELTNKNLDLVKQRSTRKSSQSSSVSQVFHGSKSRGLDLDDETSSSTVKDWNKLVQTAYQECNYERKARDMISSESILHGTLSKNRDYIRTEELFENSEIIGIRNDFMNHKQKEVSYEELKDVFNQIQKELNQEKHDKEIASNHMQNVLKENYKLRKEVLKLKGEKDKLLHQTVYSNTSSENSSENSLKRIHNNNNTNHFVDLNKDSSV